MREKNMTRTTQPASKRKAYRPEMSANWWLKSAFTRFYMLREATAIPTLWFSLLLLAGLVCLKHGPESWQVFVNFLHNPLVLVLNVITLLATLLHAKTWFELAPKAVIVVVKAHKGGPQPIITLLWVLALLTTLLVLTTAALY